MSYIDTIKSRVFISYSWKDEEHIEEARFTDEGAADPSNNLRVITEEELKKNQRNHEEK